MSNEQKIKICRDVYTTQEATKSGWSITRAQRSHTHTHTHNVQVNWQSLNQHCVCLMFAIKNNNFYSVEVCQLRRVKTIIKRIFLTTTIRVLHAASLGRNWLTACNRIVHSVHWRRRRWCWKWRNFLLSLFICKFFWCERWIMHIVRSDAQSGFASVASSDVIKSFAWALKTKANLGHYRRCHFVHWTKWERERER